jgi:hypothetical protein
MVDVDGGTVQGTVSGARDRVSVVLGFFGFFGFGDEGFD